MTTLKSYAQFNAFTVQGRIFNAELVEKKDMKFLAVTVISTAENDGQEFTVRFTNSNGLMALHESGWFGTGRMVTVTGHIAGISETYEKDGETRLRQRPEIRLTGAQILDGGLGPMPQDKEEPVRRSNVVVTAPTKKPFVDKAPTAEPIAF